MPRVVVVADDLTGAADTGVPFAQLGMATRVVWDVARRPKAEVLALSTESRECDRTEAAERVRHVAHVLAADPEIDEQRPWIYKKVDSTLRGHPGTELYELMEGMGAARALVAPAFPSQGRTTSGGLHYVHGVPLANTAFGEEVPVSDVRVRFAGGLPARSIAHVPIAVVREGVEAVVDTIDTLGFRVFVADAEHDADLVCLARAACESQTRVLCGSAGLAHALAEVVSEEDVSGEYASDEGAVDTRRSEFDLPDWWGDGVLVVAASRHPVTVRQIEALERAGVTVVRPPLDWFLHDLEADDPVVASLRYHLASAGAAVLTTQGLPDLPGKGVLLAEHLGRAVRTLFEGTCPAGLVLTGGALAIAVCEALDAEALHLVGEVEAGIPWGHLVGGVLEGMPLVTKAGGFGEGDALIAAVRRLE
ncbi:MAG: four-carbon acid sugar kinase family protein [Anaerolineae bacterium]